MKKMRRYLALLLAVAMMISMVQYGGSSADATETSIAETTVETVVETEEETEEAVEAEKQTEEADETEKQEETVTEAETEEAEESEAEKTVKSVEYENDSMTVTAKAVDGTLPADTKLSVTTVKDSGDTKSLYEAIEKKTAAYTESEIAAWFAYEVTLTDGDGKEIDPDGDVAITLKYKEATAPAAVKTLTEAGTDTKAAVMVYANGSVKKVQKNASVKTNTSNAATEATFRLQDKAGAYLVAWSTEEAVSSNNESETDEPAVVSEDSDDGEDEDPDSSEEEESLYEQLMAAETAEEMDEILLSLEDEPTFTEDELEALIEKAEAFEDDEDGYKAEVLELLNYLQTGENETETVDTGTGDEDANYWKSTVPVYWDTTNGTSGTGTSSSDTTYVTSVKLNGTAVTWGDSDATGNWSGGSVLSTYYGNISSGSSNMIDKTMSITAQTGYYVTEIIVACAPNAGGTALNPYKCGTWTSGNNLVETYKLSDSTYDSSTGQYTVTFNVNSLHFSHNGRTTPNAYFILIQVAKVPTPLFVEYQYGDISKYVTINSNSAFYDPSKWTEANSGNNYGNGNSYNSGVMTDDTQFDYQYPNTSTVVIASWKHYANTISDDALEEAAAAGYYFTGWKVTWYNDCDVSTNGDSYNNNYTFSFNNVYMEGGDSLLQPGAEVQLPTNVQLVAQWAPITLTVEKVVKIDGADTNVITTAFTMQVQKGTETKSNYENSFTLTDGASEELSTVPTGTYSVTETTPGSTVTGSDGVTYYYSGTAYSSDVELGYKSTTSTDGTVTGKVVSSGTITVTNNYTKTEPTGALEISKTVETEVDDVDVSGITTEFTFTITLKDSSGSVLSEKTYKTTTVTTGETSGTTGSVKTDTKGSVTVTLRHNQTIQIEGLPIGATYTIAETAVGGYTTTSSGTTGTITSGTTSTAAFTNTYTGGSVDVPVKKVWVDQSNTYSLRPSSITLVLKQNGADYRSQTLEDSDYKEGVDTWAYTFEDLPEYDTGGKKYTYTVTENAVTNYKTTYSTDTYTITNTLDRTWQIVKVSSSGSTVKLAGAEFELTKTGTTYYGKSDSKGVVQWYSSNARTGDTVTVDDGTYTLTETKAPSGYTKGSSWTVVVEGGIVKIDGQTWTDNASDKVIEFTYQNTPLYSLPSAGGTGIYTTTLGGMLLMMCSAFMLIMYKRKERGEVRMR